MSTITNIILLLILAGAAIFIIARSRINNKKEIKRTIIVDPKSQDSYDKEHYKAEHEELTLTLQEKIELSWKFLNKITKQFLNLFSLKDKQLTYEAGQMLKRHGAKYEHNVEEEAKVTINIIRDRVVEHNKKVRAEKSR